MRHENMQTHLADRLRPNPADVQVGDDGSSEVLRHASRSDSLFRRHLALEGSVTVAHPQQSDLEPGAVPDPWHLTWPCGTGACTSDDIRGRVAARPPRQSPGAVGGQCALRARRVSGSMAAAHAHCQCGTAALSSPRGHRGARRYRGGCDSRCVMTAPAAASDRLES